MQRRRTPERNPLTTIASAVILGAMATAPLVGLAGEGDTAARGADLLMPFKRDLKQALKAGLAEGPEQAVAACQLKAPAIAAALSKDGVRVGRTSHKLRNPANASPEWVAPTLADWLADAADRAPRTAAIAEGREGYIEPIVMQPLCTTCHGSQIEPALAERIQSLYPNDEATGFEVGELRGVFWVEYPVP